MIEILSGGGIIVLYILVCATVALLIRVFTHIKDELFRKILHMILIIALMFWPFIFEHWYVAVLTALGFIVLLFPALILAGRFKAFSSFVNERKKGEFKISMAIVLLMYAVVVAVCWGWRGDRILSLAVVSAWGYGDAAAALIGKRFGRHYIEGKHIEGRKSVEGSLAMFCTSFICVLTVLLIRGGMDWYEYIITALITAAVTAVVELYSMHGSDTVTCPFSAMAVLVPLTWLFGSVI